MDPLETFDPARRNQPPAPRIGMRLVAEPSKHHQRGLVEGGLKAGPVLVVAEDRRHLPPVVRDAPVGADNSVAHDLQTHGGPLLTT